MKNEKRNQMGIMRKVFFSVLMLLVLTLTTFSIQYVYSNNMSVDFSKTYGIYQNGVYKDTRDVLVPSPYAVQKAAIGVKNEEATARNISISIDYKGEIVKAEPSAEGDADTVLWSGEFSAYEEKTFYILGKNLAVGVPYVFVDDGSQSVSNKKLSVENNVSNKTSAANHSETFGYAPYGERADIVGAIFEEERNLDIVAKSVITIFAGFVLLTLASGLAFIFGAEERPKITKRPNIHIADLYHGSQGSDVFAKYKYEESAYWKEQ